MSQQVERPFIRGAVAIESMRDNGYKNAAYALAELIDNSIQASADNVQVMCFEHIDTSGQRNTRRVKKIGILDNGKGMSKEVLYLALEFGASKHREDPNGMGKFGMGLPNSSISQCKRVDVWSWESGRKPIHTYLDVGMMQQGDLDSIPFPEEEPLPTEIQKLINDGELSDSGTFILWSQLDRLQWKTSASIYKHSEALVGRMYRKFIANERVKVRFLPFLWNESIQGYISSDKPTATDFRANDPLYLSAISSLPDLPHPLEGEEPFEIKQYQELDIPHNGEVFKVKLTVTMIKPEVIDAIRRSSSSSVQYVGSTVWGKHMATNTGVSVVRADRELETRTDFFAKEFLNTKARFMGVEVNFPPGLDTVFGVLNNKQAAVNFHNMDLDADAEKEGFESPEDYEKDLKDNHDPKFKLYEVSDRLNKMIKNVAQQVSSLDVNMRQSTVSGAKKERPKPEVIVEIINTERSKQGNGPDPDDKIVPKDKPEIIKAIKKDSSISEVEAQDIVKEIIENNEKFKIREVGVDPTVFFDVTLFNGLTLLQLNRNHLFYKRIMENMPNEQKDLLMLCLGAWARMEMEALSPIARDKLAFARALWGNMLTTYLEEYE